MAERFAALVLAVALTSACGEDGSSSAEPPCVVPEEEMASIWGASEMSAHPQSNGLDCIYAAGDEAVVLLGVRSQRRFEAERARFEDEGILLPPLETTSGFDEQATVDPRYNSLNVEVGGDVISVEIVAAEPTDPGEQLALEKRIARAAVGRLTAAGA